MSLQKTKKCVGKVINNKEYDDFTICKDYALIKKIKDDSERLLNDKGCFSFRRYQK